VALTRIWRLAVVFASSLAILGLMMASVDPEVQYSVDELMDDPGKFNEKDVFVRGVVSPGTFSVDDLVFLLEGSDDMVLVDISKTPLPDGFDEGRTIAVRGELVLEDGIWTIISDEIQTGCPSKYEA